MKKSVALILSLVLMAGTLTACSKAAAPSENAAGAASQKIVAWAWDPNFTIPIMEDAANRYKAANPDVAVEFEIVEMANSDVVQKLHTTLASKAVNALPDVVVIEDYNALKYLQSYPGSFADLTDAINYEEFAPNKLLEYEGKMYSIPFDSGVSGLFYRSDILQEAGYTAADLENITWDRYIEIGEDVKAKTGVSMLAFDRTDGGVMRIMMQSAGDWYFDENQQSKIASSEAIKESIETYKKLDASTATHPVKGWNEWVGAFNQGEGASIVTGGWIIGSIKNVPEQSGKWAVAPIPRLNNSASKIGRAHV